MDFAETDTQRQIAQAVAAIGSRYGLEAYSKAAGEGGSMEQLWREVGEAGFLGVNLPEEYGGAGLGISELALVCEELAAAGCPLLLMLVSPAICGTVLSQFGTAEQKATWLPGLASGELKLAFAITEPDAGSNSHRLSTTAVKDGDSWRLNGQKYYISGADESDAILVVTRTSVDERTGRGRLSLFLVDRDAPGLTMQPIDMELQGPERQLTLFLDDVAVDESRLIGGVDRGLQTVFVGLNPERILGAALAVGVGRHALAKASRYANERSVWGAPIGTHQGVAHPLAKAKIELELARLMTKKAAWLHDQGSREAGEASNMAKYAAGEAAIACVDQAIQTHGGNGMSAEFGLIKLWGIVRTLRIAPVSREMILNFVAQHSLGLPRSYGHGG
jgi:alkylation response protein AidB-like acyl-CoA dehydrogenase